MDDVSVRERNIVRDQAFKRQVPIDNDDEENQHDQLPTVEEYKTRVAEEPRRPSRRGTTSGELFTRSWRS
jgi:hypothetical protein